MFYSRTERLSPALFQSKRRDARASELAEAPRQVDLPEDEARAWHRDLMAARKTLKPPKDSMAIILDTDVIIKGETGNFDLIGWLAAQTGQELEIAAFTIAELWHGIERATPPHRAKRERYLGTMVERLEAIAFTEATASVHARILGET